MIVISTATGTLHGRTIELDQTVAIADGERVELVIRSVATQPNSVQPGEGIRASAGAWADANDEEFDRWLKAAYEDRSSHRDAS